MFKVFENEKEDYKILNFQSLKIRDVVDLLRKINEMYENGYIIQDEFAPKDCPKIPRIINLKFVKKEDVSDSLLGNEEASVEVVEEEDYVDVVITEKTIDDLTKKDELLEYAASKNYEIPEEMKLPSQIKKYIKELEEVTE